MSLPPSIHAKRGKNRSERRGRYDPGWTPSEQRTRDRLMKQFTKLEGPSGNSKAYQDAPCWCWCGRLNGTHVHLAQPDLDAKLEEIGRESFDVATRKGRR